MKVLLIHNFYRSRLIGGEDVVFRQERDALVNALGSKNVFSYTVSSDNINLLSLTLNTFYSLGHYIKIRRLIKENGINLVHCHNYFPLLSFSVFSVTRSLGVRSILTLHNFRLWCVGGTLFRNGEICEKCLSKGQHYGIIHKCYHRSRLYSVILSLSNWIYRRQLNKVDQIIALSKFQRKYLIDNNLIDKSKIWVKPNAVYVGAKPEFSTNQNFEYDLLYIGKLEEAKGIKWLIQNVSKVPEIRVAVVGDGPLMTWVSKNASSGVEIFGTVSHERINEFYARSRFLIHPSLCYETFGLTIIEAMSNGKPVIALPIGTRNELIQQGVNGFLLGQKPDIDLLQIIKIDENTYRKLSDNAYEFSKKFKQKSITGELIKLYQNSLD